MKKPKELDHIDPIWSEGRDYQLVCGLDTPLNFTERDYRTNIQKSNRFIPWRVCRDEIGVEPVEPGDLCLFLDPETNDWVLEQFMGEWWWDKTSKTHGPSAGKVGKPRPDLAERNRQRRGESRTFSDDHRANLSKSGKGKPKSEESKDKMRVSAKIRCSNPEWKKKQSEVSKNLNLGRNNKGQFTKKQP